MINAAFQFQSNISRSLKDIVQNLNIKSTSDIRWLWKCSKTRLPWQVHKSSALVAVQSLSCVWLCNPMDCSMLTKISLRHTQNGWVLWIENYTSIQLLKKRRQEEKTYSTILTWENSGWDGIGSEPGVKTGVLWDTGVEACGDMVGSEGTGGFSISVGSSPWSFFWKDSPPSDNTDISIGSSSLK